MNKSTKIQRQKLTDAAAVASKNQKSEATTQGAQKAFGASPLLDRNGKRQPRSKFIEVWAFNPFSESSLPDAIEILQQLPKRFPNPVYVYLEVYGKTT